ncbi:MAG: hypothetical protein ACI841_000887 [Planctomycetota bacterium]|jgi:uncharacterized protein (DUF1501 family)
MQNPKALNGDRLQLEALMIPMILSRRSMLGAAAASLLSSPLRALALETNPIATKRKPTVIVLFLRGGMDGLNWLVPFGEDAYYRLRPGISIPRPAGDGTAVDLDGFFGLHPAASSMAPLFESGLAVALPAVGHANNSRSHFKEQDLWETAVESNEVSTSGWLNRHLGSSRGRGPVRAIALGDTLPRSLRGENSALALRGLSDLAFDETRNLDRTLVALSQAYEGKGARANEAALARSGRSSLEALEHLQRAAQLPDESKVTYPNTTLGRRAKEAARLIRADLGLEVIELDLGGWDTHQNQGRVTGSYANNVRQVSEALTALVTDLEDRLDDLMILTVTEFGRTTAQNGTNGTDHGWASCAFAMGGAVKRSASRREGPILGSWPGLAPEDLNQGRDLAHSIDFRDVYWEMLGFLGNERQSEVLGGHAYQALGLV